MTKTNIKSIINLNFILKNNDYNKNKNKKSHFKLLNTKNKSNLCLN